MRRLLIVGFSLLLLIAVIAAQTREKRIIPVDSRQLNESGANRRTGVAILAGIGRYPRYSGLAELRYPSRDVEALEAELKAQHYAVVALKDGDATKASILNAIQQAGEILDPDSGVMIFFFSGHGFADAGANYLATFDASSSSLSQTGLRIQDLEKAMEAAGSKRRVLWIDACRNEPGKGAAEGRSFAAFKQSDGTRMLFSTKFGRMSYEDDELRQGVFSHFLIQGLRGEAAKSDGLISFRDLADFAKLGVENRSLATGHVQMPYEAGEASGDFLIGRVAAREPVKVPAKIAISREELTRAGLSFAPADSRPMCLIEGSDGPCRVEAFVGGETRVDTTRNTCAKLDRASYRGKCSGGLLEGVAALFADGSAKSHKTTFLTYFSGGQIGYPSLNAINVDDFHYFSVHESRLSYGCVVFGDKAWERKDDRSCAVLRRFWGPEIFTESNLQELTGPSVNIEKYDNAFRNYLKSR